MLVTSFSTSLLVFSSFAFLLLISFRHSSSWTSYDTPSNSSFLSTQDKGTGPKRPVPKNCFKLFWQETSTCSNLFSANSLPFSAETHLYILCAFSFSHRSVRRPIWYSSAKDSKKETFGSSTCLEDKSSTVTLGSRLLSSQVAEFLSDFSLGSLQWTFPQRLANTCTELNDGH